jgi:cytidine deaminase
MIDALVAAATQARENAYAPYSNFAVGAAVMDDQGGIHIGCNVENAAYPQGQCAEATAIGVMVAAGGRCISAIAVAGPNGVPCTPCGGCRQRIREFAAPDTPVLICSGGKIIAQHTLADLLPHSFGPENLA